MIVLVFISVFIGVILKILGILKGPILILFSIFVLYLIIRGIKEIKQNKGRRKSIFYEREKLSLIDLLKPQINNLKGCRCYKIYENMILLVNNNGLYIIYVADYHDTIEGLKNDEFLKQKHGNRMKYVKNIIKDLEEIKKLIVPDDIYLIVNNDCYFNVKVDIKVIRQKQFYYEFMKIDRKYSDEEVVKLYEKSCQLLSKK